MENIELGTHALELFTEYETLKMRCTEIIGELQRVRASAFRQGMLSLYLWIGDAIQEDA